MANITSLLKYSLKTNIVKSILFEIISNTSRYFYTFGRCLPWPEVIGPRSANIFTVERTNNVVRITTRTPHGLFVNDKIIVSANTLTQINNPPSTSPKTIVQVERSAGVVTITTQNAHGFLVGDIVEINTDLDAIDGIFTITEKVGAANSTVFRFVNPGNNINLTTDIDGTASLYTAFTVTDVINDLTFTYNKTGPNIQSVAEIGEVFSIEKDVISNENDPPSVSDNYPYELEVRNEMLVMKLIDSNDVSIVVPRINWQPGIIYDMFDEYSGDRLSYSGSTSLAQAKFYVLTDEFNVYKCIFNNNDKASSIKPTSTSPTSEELTLADGYIWKFMYTIPISLRNKFLTSEYMPVLSALSNQFYSSGSITNYSVISSGNGYIANTYRVKSFDITNNGSGYTATSNVAANTFTITQIARTSGEMTITVDSNHNIPLTTGNNIAGGAIKISPSVTTITIGGNSIPLDLVTTQNPNGIHVIKKITSQNSFTIDNGGSNIPLTSIGVVGGQINLTGAVIEFPLVATGTQARAYVSQYGSGGTIEQIIITNQGSGYLTPPIPTITMLNGLNPLTQVEYSINYDFKDTTNGYTEVIVEGDGYNLNNPFSLKRVIINENQRGVFNSVITGEIFDFPDPDLDKGRKPSVNVTFQPITKTYNISVTGRLNNEALVAISGTSTTSASISNVIRGGNIVTITTVADHGFLVGQTVVISVNTNITLGGTFTITSVPSSDSFTYSQTGVDISSSADTGTATVLTYSIGDQIIISGTSNGGGVFNGTHTITAINGLSIYFASSGSNITQALDSGTVVNVAGELGYEVADVVVLDEGYGYSKPFIFGDDTSDNYFSVFANSLTTNGFNCSLDENNQKNSAVLAPLINSLGQIESLQIIEPGIGYTYAFINVKGYKKEGASLIQMTPFNTSGFKDANIQLRFSVGDIDSRQSTVELLAKEGSISCIKVENGGQNYAAGTRIVVLGDGTGCQAVPEIQGGKIVKVTLLNAGLGYTKAEAFISGPMTGNNPLSITPVTNGTGATIRTIISPKGGHGRDAISELYGRSIYFTSRLSNEKNKGIVTYQSGLISPNDYRQVTILKNPSKYNVNEYYVGSFGSACILVSANINTNNVNSYNNIFKDDVLELSTDSSKKFVVVEKQTVRLGKDTVNKLWFVLQTVDNNIPEVNSVLTKVTSTNTYSLVISSVQVPDFNKFTGEMLYINNRTAFTPSEQQTVVISTLINF